MLVNPEWQVIELLKIVRLVVKFLISQARNLIHDLLPDQARNELQPAVAPAISPRSSS